jgi:hypothetical protein
VSEDERLTQNEILFLQVVSMFQVAAMQQMGKLPNPLTHRIERDLGQAKVSVDMIAMLKEKTARNLNKREADYLAKVLFECQMNYLDELKKPEPGPSAGAEDDSKMGEGGDAGGARGTRPE